MRWLSACLYTAPCWVQTPAAADTAALEALREGDMKKLVFHAEPQARVDAVFVRCRGRRTTLAEFEGKHVVLNFWATWCAPCRKEMPMLSEPAGRAGRRRLRGGDHRHGPQLAAGIRAFFEEIGVDNLPQHRDPRRPWRARWRCWACRSP
jgi:thiol-disulfide isomerase/thioredoxin